MHGEKDRWMDAWMEEGEEEGGREGHSLSPSGPFA